MKLSEHSVKGEDADKLRALWTEFEAQYGKQNLDSIRYRVLVSLGDTEAAAPIGRRLVEAAVEAKNAPKLNQITWDIVDPGRKIEKRDLMLAMYGATIACDLTGWKDASILDTLARAHYMAGSRARAIELQSSRFPCRPRAAKKCCRRPSMSI
ncbi:MAG: hypothetical protein R3F17_02065 [Planctomycetota bacterium]